MARSFRYFGKKRGHRRTGSPVLGSAGEAAFFAVLLLLGCGGFVQMFSREILPDWRVNHEFVETKCKVLEKRVDEKEGEEGRLYRPEIRIEYEAFGTLYRGLHYDVHRTYSSGREDAQAILDRFALYDAAKELYPCWYDPANPGNCVLVRGYPGMAWLVFTVPLPFIVIGAGGLIYTVFRWGKSAERRAASARRTAERDLFGGAGGENQYPFVPRART